jgi:tRNA pseudouridine38-40 synthase
LKRYRLDISYNGSRYAGWQIQPNASTIQQHIEEALNVLEKSAVRIHGSGRTDAGVHARRQVAHTDLSRLHAGEEENWKRSLNGLLPNDIVIIRIKVVSEDFHARFDANYRTYHYYFSDAHQPLFSDTTAVWWYPLDYDAMNRAAGFLSGDLDCSSFTPQDPELGHYRCWFFEASVSPPDEYGRAVFRVTANRFLRSVVRSLMGTLIEVGRGNLQPEDFYRLFIQPDRSAAGTTAPSKGLVLYDVGYDRKWHLPGDAG